MSTQRIVNLIKSCLFTHGAPICSNMESCLAAKSSFPAQLIISSSGRSFLRTPRFSSRTDKSQYLPKTRTVHWKNVFAMRRLLRRWLHCSASRVIVSCCNICLISIKQQNSFYYLGKFHDFFSSNNRKLWLVSTKKQLKQIKELSSSNQRENTTL